MTPCDRLEGIVSHGGLLSLRGRAANQVAEPLDPHYWGSADKKEAFEGYVICAFMPPWWMCKAHDEELVIVLLDAEAVCCREGVLFCPGNSAYNDYPADQIKNMRGIDSFNACFRGNPNTSQTGYSEIIVPERVDFSDFRGLVFCDEEAREYWVERIRETWRALDRKPPRPPADLEVREKSAFGFGFPPYWTATRRVR